MECNTEMREKEKEFIFENLKRVADTVVKAFGRNCEVAIHDFANLKQSLIYIAGEVTKRKPGAPITDLVVKELRKKDGPIEDLHNYQTTTQNGRILKSSTTFIRNSNGEVIGAFCLNYDITDVLNSISLAQDFVKITERETHFKSETFASSFTETIESLVNECVAQIGKQPSTMSIQEKIQLVEMLEQKGTFLIKGAVEYLAVVMGVSKYTVYNYLKKVRAKETVPQ